MRNSMGIVLSLFIVLGMSACSGDNNNNDTSSPAPQSSDTIEAYVLRNFTVVPGDPSQNTMVRVRDASGVIWALEFALNISPNSLAQACDQRHGKAPTMAQLTQLAIYLGRGTSFGFHPEATEALKAGFYWGGFPQTLLIGTDSFPPSQGVVGVDGKDGNSNWIATDIAGDTTGVPQQYDPSNYDPDQRNFGTICVFDN